MFSFDPACIVDWNSPQQVAPVFKKLGFNTTVFDSETEEDKDTPIERLVERADKQLYNAKKRGKNCVSYLNEIY